MAKMKLTKADLAAFKDLIDTRVTTIIDTRVTTIVNQIVDQKIDQLRNEILEFKDEILGEIRSLRDEVTIVTGYKNQLENHEDRLTKVEKHLRISPSPVA